MSGNIDHKEQDSAFGEQAGDTGDQPDVAFRIAALSFGVITVVLSIYLFLAFQLGAWQVFALTGIVGVFGVAVLVSLVLIRRGRPTLGMGIIIAGTLIVFLTSTLLIAGLGLVMGLCLLLLNFSIAAQTLPPQHASRAIFAGAVAAGLTLLLDLYGGDYRLRVSIQQTVLPAIVAALLLVYGALIAREFRNYTLRAKLITSFVGVSAVAVIGVSLVTFRVMRSEFEEQVGESYTVEAESLSRLIITFFKAKVTQVMSLTTMDTIKDQLTQRNASYSGDSATILAEIQALDVQWVAAGDSAPFIRGIITPDPATNPTAYQLVSFLKIFPSHTEIFVTDRYGATLGATGRLSDYYQADEGWWQAAWNGGEGAIYISDPEYDASAGVTALLIAAPVFDPGTGEALGVVRSTLNVGSLFAQIKEVQYGETGHAVLFNSSAEVLYEPVAEGAQGPTELPLDVRQHFLEKEAHYEVEADADGERFILAHAPISASGAEKHETGADIGAVVTNLGWAAVIRQETSEAFAPITRLERDLQVLGLVIFALVGLGAWLVARLLTQPILALTEAADAMSAGDLDVMLPPAHGDEIGRLTVSFGNMTGQLKRTLSSLQGRNEHLQSAVRQYSDVMVEVGQGNLEARIILEDEWEQDDPLLALGHNLNEMTTSLQRMIDQERLQQQTIEAQQQALYELSTPIIPVMERIIVMPLVGSIDSMRAQDIMRTLLAGIREHRAQVVILDITGVPIVDSGVANHLNKTIQAARLKGAQTIITGISDAVAEAIVDLGIDWSQVQTLGNLQAGLLAALESLGIKLGT